MKPPTPLRITRSGGCLWDSVVRGWGRAMEVTMERSRRAKRAVLGIVVMCTVAASCGDDSGTSASESAATGVSTADSGTSETGGTAGGGDVCAAREQLNQSLSGLGSIDL